MDATKDTKITPPLYPQLSKISYMQCPKTKVESLSVSLDDCHMVVSSFNQQYLGHFYSKARSVIGRLEQSYPYFCTLKAAYTQQQEEIRRLILKSLPPKATHKTTQLEAKTCAQHEITEREAKQEENKANVTLTDSKKRRLRRQRLAQLYN